MENSQENTTFILADVKVFDFLKEKAGDRKTKTEAYWDLLDRSMAGFVSPFVRKLERKLLPNQCHVTISDLAEFWHWHRATVRTFLDALESFGLLERTKLNKSVIITMTVQSGKNATAGTEQDEPDFATRIGSILSEWVIGKKTSEDAGHSCGQALCQALAAIAGKDNSQASGNGTDTVSAEVVRQEEKLRETILECIANAALQRVLRKSRFDNTERTRRTLPSFRALLYSTAPVLSRDETFFVHCEKCFGSHALRLDLHRSAAQVFVNAVGD